MFPFTVVAACNLPVYASQRPLPAWRVIALPSCPAAASRRMARARCCAGAQGV